MGKPKKLTPMLEQYLLIKEAHPDSILFYRMGDFYEMFFEDAKTAAPVLEVQLTSRDKNAENPIPMCGIPHHAAGGYVQKLLARGHKVALCEQVEDPATAKGIVKREVVRILTPSLVGDPDLLPEESTNLLIAINESDTGLVRVCLFDLLGGQAQVGEFPSHRPLLDLLFRRPPKEFLIPPHLRDRAWFRHLRKLFPDSSTTCRQEYFEHDAPIFDSICAYLKETQKTDELDFMPTPVSLGSEAGMELDATTLSSLEILKGETRLSEGHSLFQAIEKCHTPMGKRLLREWLSRPLVQVEPIQGRLDAVEALIDRPSSAGELKELLSEVRDLERLSMKAALNLANPRDLVAIRGVLTKIEPLRVRLQTLDAKRLQDIHEQLDPLPKLQDTLNRALAEDPPASLSQGGIFRAEWSTEIGELRSLAHDAKSTIAQMEDRERKATGISTLKIKFNKVFGYHIEVTRTNLDRVPEHYQRKQTIANGERYVTDELKGFEEKVISAEHRLKGLEEREFIRLRSELSRFTPSLLANARLIGELDVLLNFAVVASDRGYCKPEIHLGSALEIEEGRHPVIETLLEPGEFIPNDIHLEDGECRTMVITGPNMAGKSTIMRQVALITLLGQAGCYVPARRAKLPIVDAIFTRIGSSDDLAQGQSTFMVEMTEVARILERASRRSLILIDEIGRGTSTYDGLSLAWSLLEHLHEEVASKTLFATHFHEIAALEKTLPGLKNFNVLVDRRSDEIVFLHRLAPGTCAKSYGVEVARLAGLPPKVLTRAQDILGHLESQSQRSRQTRSRALELHDNQMALFAMDRPSETRAE